jgi:hypothetical protein
MFQHKSVPRGFSNVEDITKGIDAINNYKTSANVKSLWTPNLRLQTAAHDLKTKPLLSGSKIGVPILLKSFKNIQNRPNVPFNNTLFSKNYLSRNTAMIDYQKSTQNLEQMKLDMKLKNDQRFRISEDTPPPLIITYNGTQDKFIPVTVSEGGAITPTKLGLPDIMLNFHHISESINPVFFHIDPKKYKQIEIAVTVLYGMTSHNDKPISIEEFVKIYDNKRLELLRALNRKHKFIK